MCVVEKAFSGRVEKIFGIGKLRGTMYDRAYHEANRERINQRHRDNYVKHRDVRNAKRRAEYQLQREQILQKQKEDRAPCPLCHLMFRRVYVPRHISLRHNLSNVAQSP